MASSLNPNPFLVKWGVIIAHLIGIIILSGIVILFGFLYLLMSSEYPDWGGEIYLLVFIVWGIQIFASLYSSWKVAKGENAPTFRFILLPLGVLSLITGLFFTYILWKAPSTETTIPLMGLFSLWVAITDFQTFRMLSPKIEKKSKSNITVQKKQPIKRRKK